ncbi:MAG: SulP family inorganic anion transporter [Leptospiraceae bacterium]|nr:SulP family inorganic anion transporter [Leptospiraceae bacterium]
MKELFREFKNDLPASIVVFFVALPLCLGIALASGAPLFAGVIAGILGGIVVGSASGSTLGVSGPAAGLAVIVLTAISTLGSWEIFLLAVVLAGVLQIIMGYLRLGIIAYYFPASVIKGMLTGIGLIIILKQIPHAIGYTKGDISISQLFGNSIIETITPGAIIITIISMSILILWDSILIKKHKIFTLIQGPLVAVLFGILLNLLFKAQVLPFSLNEKQVVSLPVATNLQDFLGQFRFPDWSAFLNINVYTTAFVIAIIASLETLLCVEATDKLDPAKRITPTNRELRAQGIGNIISGLIGGLPITQVIVRSSANISFGAKSKLSAISHGFLLLISAITIPAVLNLIPLATLASILFIVGYKLAKPTIFKEQYRIGLEQFVPFLATVIAILFTDLLRGIGVGLVFAILSILRHNYRNPYYFHKEEYNKGEIIKIILSENVTFLNKANILQTLNHIPSNSKLEIDGSKSLNISHDVIEIIRDFSENAKLKNIELKVININGIS